MIATKQIFVSTQKGIPLGYQGENGVTEIIFSQPEELLGQNWTLLHQRATDREPYPVPLDVTARGLVWAVTSGDTAVNGNGLAQLICSGPDGEILKTVTYNTSVAKSLHLCGEAPDPVKPWYDDIQEKLEQAGGGTVKSVNGVVPDGNGNVEIDTGGDVKTVNGIEPDENGNVEVEVDGVSGEELETALAGKANAQHTHSLSDIEEVETITARTTLAEGVFKGVMNNLPSSFKEVKYDHYEGASVILSVGGVEYAGTISSEPVYYYVCTDSYTIAYSLLDDMATINPSPEAGTTIKLEVVESKTVIPEQYLPDTSKVSDEHINALIDEKLGVIENGSY